MSTSIGAATSAPSYQSLFSQQGVGGADSTDPLDELLQELAGPSDSSAQTAPADADAGGSGVPSTAFDPSTFTALLSAQEQAGGDGGSSASSSTSGSGGGGHVGGGDPLTSQSDTSADGSTTETVTNPDGSVTTIVTNADGTTSETTAAAPPSINASSANGESDDDLSEGMQQLQALLQPLASVAMAALL